MHVTVAPTIEHHGRHSRTPASQRWDQVPGRTQWELNRDNFIWNVGTWSDELRWAHVFTFTSCENTDLLMPIRVTSNFDFHLCAQNSKVRHFQIIPMQNPSVVQKKLLFFFFCDLYHLKWVLCKDQKVVEIDSLRFWWNLHNMCLLVQKVKNRYQSCDF